MPGCAPVRLPFPGPRWDVKYKFLPSLSLCRTFFFFILLPSFLARLSVSRPCAPPWDSGATDAGVSAQAGPRQGRPVRCKDVGQRRGPTRTRRSRAVATHHGRTEWSARRALSWPAAYLHTHSGTTTAGRQGCSRRLAWPQGGGVQVQQTIMQSHAGLATLRFSTTPVSGHCISCQLMGTKGLSLPRLPRSELGSGVGKA